jgi:hypothetical protein
MPHSRAAIVGAMLTFLATTSCLGDSGSLSGDAEDGRSGTAQRAVNRPHYPSNDPGERACGLPADQLARIWRGYDPRRSEDVFVVPRKPAFFGSISVVSHSGPWDYLQRVPLVLYGPGHIRTSGPVGESATLADVYPTVGELVGVQLEPRAGTVLDQAVMPGALRRPKLVVTIVWDGVGRNVLDYWGRKWPTLARLEHTGTSYRNATVGSSPSITPATHATLGTGTFPRAHRVTGIFMRAASGVVKAFEGTDPTDLSKSTFAEQIDMTLGNEPRVGLLGWSDWHLPMVGRGLAMKGGDADDVGIILLDSNVGGNSDFFSTPSYLDGFPGLDDRVDSLDRADGKADGEWLGHDILSETRSPAWVEYATDMLLAMLEREAYGADRTTDLMFVNYKMTDYIGHYQQFESQEMAAVLRAQDNALKRLVDFLDAKVRDYVVIVTADHGHTPKPARTGGWPIGERELKDDIHDHFGVASGADLVEEITAVGIFLNRSAMAKEGATLEEVATFVNGYTIGQNSTAKRLPRRFRGRESEQVFAAAWPAGAMDAIMRCRFGRPRPPRATGDAGEQ